MYGFVNHALELLVVRNYGDEIWEKIKKEAEIEMEGSFLVRLIYDDENTYNLINAAEKVLNIPANQILELFGSMFFDFCQESGYDKILKVLGATPRDFLQNLDALHDHLATIYPGMRAPSFRCTERPEDGALILHYYSEREGLEHIVIGIVKAVASQLHGSQVQVHIIATKQGGIDHVQFSIIEKSKTGKSIIEPTMEEFEALSLDNKISPLTFCRAFPFHIVFDRNLCIRQAGTSVARVLPALTTENCLVTDVFDMIRPHMEFTFNNILSHINTVFVIRSRANNNHNITMDSTQSEQSSTSIDQKNPEEEDTVD